MSDTMESFKDVGGSPPQASVRIKHVARNSDGTSRFPKLDECAHFHYDNVELGPISVVLLSEEGDDGGGPKGGGGGWTFRLQVSSGGRSWQVRRSLANVQMLDRQLHRCVYDRKFSLLPDFDSCQAEELEDAALRTMLTQYLERFSQLAGSLINCGPVLNWLELDNRGNRLIVTDEAAINTPAVAAAYVTKRYASQANDEISLEVGDIISVIDMPPPEESSWWRGKKGFQVGFFPCECVEIIGDKVPQSIKFPKVSSKPVLRKHGKLIAFFRSFLLSRPSRRKLKQSGILKERVFGCDLGEHLMNSGRDIPLVLKCCAEFIEHHGIVDGIYRLSGVTSNIQKLRVAFDEDRVPDLYDEAILQDIHCVASLLKMYFRELPNPLLTFHLYDKFVSAVQAEEDLRLLKLRDVVQQLPPPHYRSLEYLMRHLSKVAAHGYQTGMTPKNVAIVWAPNLLRSRDIENGGVGALHVVGVQAVLTEYLIRYTDIIFSEKMPIFPTLTLGEDTPKKTRPKSLAISTPTKLLSLEEARSRALTSNLLGDQQKFIDVGGGEENLPVKYHTVIELPARRRSVGKGKKSPSGWRSFFSRGWQTTSGRRKNRRSRNENERPKIGSPIFCGRSPLVLQDKAVTESDVSHTNTKKLRTVKSAEALFPVHSSSLLKPHNQIFSPVDEHPSSHKEIHMPPIYHAQYLPSLKKSTSCHTHFRSTSHDSYFERISEQPEEDEVDQDGSIEDDGHSHSSQNINFGPEKEVGSNGENLRSCETTPRRKIAQKQKLVSFDSEASSPKLQKISLKRLYHTLSSPPLVKKRDTQLETDASSSEKQSLIEKEQMQSRKIHVLPRNKSESCIKVEKCAVPPDIQLSHRTLKTLVPSTESSDAHKSSSDKDTVSVEVHEPLWDTRQETRAVNCTAPQQDIENNVEIRSKEESNGCSSTEKTLSDSSSLPHLQSYSSGDKSLDSTGLNHEQSERDLYPLSSCLTAPETGKTEKDLIALQQGVLITCDQSSNNLHISSGNSPSVQTVQPQSVQSSMHESFSYDILKSFSSPDVPSYNSAQDHNLSSDSSFVGSIILSPPENFVDDSSPASQKERTLSEIKDDYKPPGTRGLERSMTEVHEICPKFATGISVSGSFSHELFKANRDLAEKNRSCSDKLSPISPIEESRRKFESEIGRLIVRDRQMKHEMEKIKAERQAKQEKPFAQSSERTSKNERKFADVLENRKSPVKSIEYDKRKPDSDDVLKSLKDSVDDRKNPDTVSGYCSFLRLESKPSVKELLSKFEGPKREVGSLDAFLKHSTDVSITSSPGVFSNVQVINHGATSLISSDLNQSSKDNQNSHSREHIFQTECVVRFPHPKTSSVVRQDCVDSFRNGSPNNLLINESFGSNSWTSGESDHLMTVSGSRTSFLSSDNLAPDPVRDRQTSFLGAGKSQCASAEHSLPPQNGNSSVSLKTAESINLERPFSAFKDAFERASRLTHQMRSEFFQRGLSQETFGFGNGNSPGAPESCESSHASRSTTEGRRRPSQARPRPKSVPPPVNRLSVASKRLQTPTNSFQNSITPDIPKLYETPHNVPKTFGLNGNESPSTSQIHDPPKRIKERAALFERSLSFSGYADRKTQPSQKAQSNSSDR